MTVPGITVFGQQSHPDWTAGTPIAEDATGFPTDYVALDLETTGFYPNRCAITEIGAVRVRGGRVVDQFQQLINPLCPIPRQITALTGITDAMVADHDPIDGVLPNSFPGSPIPTPRLRPSPSSVIMSASICDSWTITPAILRDADSSAPTMTPCKSAVPCSPSRAITGSPT